MSLAEEIAKQQVLDQNRPFLDELVKAQAGLIDSSQGPKQIMGVPSYFDWGDVADLIAGVGDFGYEMVRSPLTASENYLNAVESGHPFAPILAGLELLANVPGPTEALMSKLGPLSMDIARGIQNRVLGMSRIPKGIKPGVSKQAVKAIPEVPLVPKTTPYQPLEGAIEKDLTPGLGLNPQTEQDMIQLMREKSVKGAPETIASPQDMIALKNPEFDEAMKISTKLPIQNVVTHDDAVNWLAQRNLMPDKPSWTPAVEIDKAMAHPEYMELPVFDRARIMSVLERPERPKIYSTEVNLGQQNTKMKGSNIYEVDTIRGCDNECIECYALKGAAQSQITHNKVVQATLKGKLPLDGISRFGVVGDAAADWAWSVDQVRQALERTPGATAQKNVMAVTKLQNIEGFDPKIFPNLEISLDPIFPASMKKTMENALLLKTQHPELNIAFRIRTLQSNSDELMKSQKFAEDFVKALDSPMLETRMRFVRNSTMDALELNMDKYHRVGNQFKLKDPVLNPSYKGYELCDSALVGCEGCGACGRLVQKTFGQGPGKPLNPSQIGAAIALLEGSNLGMGNEER